jgi:hypothetical protein
MVSNAFNYFDIHTIESHLFFPPPLVQDLLRGRGFGNTNQYTILERDALNADIQDVVLEILKRGEDRLDFEEDKYVIFAVHPPGYATEERLSKLFNVIPTEYPPLSLPFCLNRMRRTYLAACASGSKESAEKKWKPGAIALCSIALGHLVASNRGLYFAPWSFGNNYSIMAFFTERGYTIRLLHLTASPSACIKFDTTLDEQKIKDKIFLTALEIVMFVEQSAGISFCWEDPDNRGGVLVKHESGPSEAQSELGSLYVWNDDHYRDIKRVHNASLPPDSKLRWEEAVEKDYPVS